MDAFVHEAGDHQRNAGDQVPAQAIARHAVVLHVGDFVDEAAQAIEGEHGNHGQPGGGGHRQPGQQDQQRQRAPAQHGTGQRVGPIDGRPVGAQFAAQRGGEADHGHIFPGQRSAVLARG